MTQVRTQRDFLTRAVIAGVVTLLLVLQGLVFAGSAALARTAGDGVSPSVVASASHCIPSSGDTDPAKRHADHSLCCIFCNANVRDATFIGVAAFLVAMTVAVGAAAATVVRPNRDDFDKHPTGWTSSWSSRAPPSFF